MFLLLEKIFFIFKRKAKLFIWADIAGVQIRMAFMPLQQLLGVSIQNDNTAAGNLDDESV